MHGTFLNINKCLHVTRRCQEIFPSLIWLVVSTVPKTINHLSFLQKGPLGLQHTVGDQGILEISKDSSREEHHRKPAPGFGSCRNHTSLRGLLVIWIQTKERGISPCKKHLLHPPVLPTQTNIDGNVSILSSLYPNGAELLEERKTNRTFHLTRSSENSALELIIACPIGFLPRILWSQPRWKANGLPQDRLQRPESISDNDQEGRCVPVRAGGVRRKRERVGTGLCFQKNETKTVPCLFSLQRHSPAAAGALVSL